MAHHLRHLLNSASTPPHKTTIITRYDSELAELLRVNTQQLKDIQADVRALKTGEQLVQLHILYIVP
jgi:hypothetical protein